MSLRERFSAADRLALLRNADRQRAWHSLDDQRYCLCCHHAFSGHQVEIKLDPDGAGEPRCPTNGCGAGPADWFFYGSGHGAADGGGDGAEVDLSSW